MDDRKCIVNAIFEVLSDRGGIEDSLAGIQADPEVYKDMYAECVDKVGDHLEFMEREVEGSIAPKDYNPLKDLDDRWAPNDSEEA
jgi:hypothetical protein